MVLRIWKWPHSIAGIMLKRKALISRICDAQHFSPSEKNCLIEFNYPVRLNYWKMLPIRITMLTFVANSISSEDWCKAKAGSVISNVVKCSLYPDILGMRFIALCIISREGRHVNPRPVILHDMHVSNTCMPHKSFNWLMQHAYQWTWLNTGEGISHVCFGFHHTDVLQNLR